MSGSAPEVPGIGPAADSSAVSSDTTLQQTPITYIANGTAQAQPQPVESIGAQSATPAPIRDDQVQNAVAFLTHPKVRSSATATKRSFLERKGLTAVEIDEAFRRVPEPTEEPSTSGQVTTTSSATTPVAGVHAAAPGATASHAGYQAQPSSTAITAAAPHQQHPVRHGAPTSAGPLLPPQPAPPQPQPLRWSQVVLGAVAVAGVAYAAANLIVPRLRAMYMRWCEATAARRAEEEKRNEQIQALITSLSGLQGELSRQSNLIADAAAVMRDAAAASKETTDASSSYFAAQLRKLEQLQQQQEQLQAQATSGPYMSAVVSSGTRGDIRGPGPQRFGGSSTANVNNPGLDETDRWWNRTQYGSSEANGGGSSYAPTYTSVGPAYGGGANGNTNNVYTFSNGLAAAANGYEQRPKPYGASSYDASGAVAGAGNGNGLSATYRGPYSGSGAESPTAPHSGSSFAQANGRPAPGGAYSPASPSAHSETYASGGAPEASALVPHLPPPPLPPSMQPAYSASFTELVDMVARGITPPNVRTDINDTPPDPNQPLSQARLAPRPKPWERTAPSSSSSLSQQQPQQQPFKQPGSGTTSGAPAMVVSEPMAYGAMTRSASGASLGGSVTSMSGVQPYRPGYAHTAAASASPPVSPAPYPGSVSYASSAYTTNNSANAAANATGTDTARAASGELHGSGGSGRASSAPVLASAASAAASTSTAAAAAAPPGEGVHTHSLGNGSILRAAAPEWQPPPVPTRTVTLPAALPSSASGSSAAGAVTSPPAAAPPSANAQPALSAAGGAAGSSSEITADDGGSRNSSGNGPSGSAAGPSGSAGEAGPSGSSSGSGAEVSSEASGEASGSRQ